MEAAVQILDQFVTAPLDVAVARAREALDGIVGAGLGAMVEYELFRRYSRPELPPLADHSSEALVRSVVAHTAGTAEASRNIQLQATSYDLVRLPTRLAEDPTWTAFKKRAEVTARGLGLGEEFSAGLAAAIHELADNVLRHSDRPDSGLAGFARAEGKFEYVVADAGIGMLASLRQATEFRSLRDDMEALPLAITPGISRFGRGSGCGYGFRYVLAPLRGARGVVRLRSGEAALIVEGRGPGPDEGLCMQRPFQQGVTVAVQVDMGSAIRT